MYVLRIKLHVFSLKDTDVSSFFQSVQETARTSLSLNKTTEAERQIMDASGVNFNLHCVMYISLYVYTIKYTCVFCVTVSYIYYKKQ